MIREQFVFRGFQLLQANNVRQLVLLPSGGIFSKHDVNGRLAGERIRQTESLDAKIVLSPHGDPGGPPHGVVVARYRQAALFALRLAFGGDDLRVDEYLELVAGHAHVDYDDALVDIDLCGREADAGRGIHGFDHVADQFPDVCRHDRHRGGGLSQPRIRVFEDVQDHKSLQNAYSGCRITSKPLFWGSLGR